MHYLCRYFCLFLFNCFFLTSAFSHEDFLYEVGLNEKIENSSTIVVGEVIDQNSYWNQDATMIYTNNTVKVYSIFKGVTTSQEVMVRTVGGQVGNSILTASELLTLDIGDFGMFFLNDIKSSSIYSVFASKQGFIHLEGGNAICPFYEKSSTELFTKVKKATKKFEEFFALPSIVFTTKSVSAGSISFSPTEITAGTQSILNITGSGFGTSGPDPINYVEFADANEGGAPFFYQATNTSYVSWSDTLIQVYVPTRAGSGPLRITVDDTTTESTNSIVVPYAISNTSETIPVQQNANGSGGVTWTLSTNMSTNAANSFIAALDTWKCGTGINWIMDATTTTTTAPDGMDNLNTVSITTTPSGVLGVCYTVYNTCNGTDSYIIDQDIVFSPTVNWNYSPGLPTSGQFDFESVALHELGHAHTINHVVFNGDIMNYNIANGVIIRTLNFYNLAAGTLVMDLSTVQSPCPLVIPMTQLFPTGCSAPNLADVEIRNATDSLNNQTCMGPQDVKVDISNFGYDSCAQILFGWSVNGLIQTSFSWTGNVAPGDSIIDLVVGNYVFGDSLYDVSVWVESSNGSVEIFQMNDTTSFQFHAKPCVPNNVEPLLIYPYDEYSCLFTEPIVIDFFNEGTNSLTNCWFYFADNGVVQDSFYWTGSLNPDDTAFNITIGTYDFSTDVELTVWSALPNGVLDEYPINDTLSLSVSPQKLQGTYTIGGISPDFITITEALNRLNTYGICDDVVFNIRSGIYIEELYFDSIPSNGIHTVTIQSEALDADSVIIKKGPGPWTTGHLVEIDSSMNLIFNDLTLNFDDGGFFSDVMYIDKGANNLEFNRMIFDLFDPDYAYGETSKVGAAIYRSNSRLSKNIRFYNNTFLNGAHAIRTNSNSSLYSSFVDGLIIENNEILDQSKESLTLQRASGLKVKNNTINANNKLASGFGSSSQFKLNNCSDSVEISGNYFRFEGLKNVLQINGCLNSVSNPMRIFNNSIYFTDDEINTHALAFSGCGHADIINNTISQFALVDSTAAGMGISVVTCDSIVLINNHIIQNSEGRLLYTSPGTGLYSNNNNFWTNGNQLTNVNGTGNATLIAHQTNTGQDLNSWNIYPDFIGDYYQVPLDGSLDDLGTPISYVSTDFLGLTRDATTPDIGAFEFLDFDYDIGILSSNLGDSIVCNSSGLDLYIDIENFGNQVVDSFFIYVNIENNVYDTVPVYQVIPPGGQASILVGNYSFPNNLSNELTIETASPNGIQDSSLYNNIYTIDVYSKLNGSYTIGDSISDFYLLNDAVDYLNNNGICGPVVFNIKDGIYASTTALNAEIHTIDGSSTTNTVTFQSESLDSTAVTFEYAYHLFTIFSAGNIIFNALTFDGQPLWGGYGADAVHLESAQNIVIKNCHFDKTQIELDYTPGGVITYDNVHFLNNYFINARIDFDVSQNALNDGLLIEGNYFKDESRIVLNRVLNAVIKGNTFDTQNSSYNNLSLTQNKNFTIIENKYISSASGIGVHSCSALTGEMNLIANNFIRAEKGMLSVVNSSDLKIVHNNFYQYGNSTLLPDHCIRLAGSSDFEFMNNIVQSVNSKAILNLYFADTVEFNPHNNIYFSNVDSLVKLNYGTTEQYYSFDEWTNNLNEDPNSYWIDPTYVSPLDLHLNNTLLADGNAIPLPYVTTDIDFDPRDPVNPDIGADEIGINWALIFDLTLDSLISPNLSGCAFNDSIVVKFTNTTGDTLTSTHFSWSVDNGPTSTLNWNGLLLPGQSDEVYLGLWTYTGSTSNLEVVLGGFNGQTDPNPTNNVLNIQYTEAVDVLIFAPVTEFCENSSATLTAQPQPTGNTYLWSWQGATTPAISVNQSAIVSLISTTPEGCVSYDTLEVVQIANPSAQFTVSQDTLFTATPQSGVDFQWYLNGTAIIGATTNVFDAELTGEYTLVAINSSGCTDTSAIHYFVASTNSLVSLNNSNIMIVPNPASDYIKIIGLKTPFTYSFIDASGRLVRERTEETGNLISLKGISDGIYFMIVELEQQTTAIKFSVLSK